MTSFTDDPLTSKIKIQKSGDLIQSGSSKMYDSEEKRNFELWNGKKYYFGN
jgi:hypothetical protein